MPASAPGPARPAARPWGPPHPRRQPDACTGAQRGRRGTRGLGGEALEPRREADALAGREGAGQEVPATTGPRLSQGFHSTRPRPRQRGLQGLPGPGSETFSFLSMTSGCRQQPLLTGAPDCPGHHSKKSVKQDKGPVHMEDRSVPSEGHCRWQLRMTWGPGARAASLLGTPESWAGDTSSALRTEPASPTPRARYPGGLGLAWGQ